ncbi:MAG: hypothetical protein E6I73_05165 [Chloroflexi bacterium]|nr:MAG: hypothetical protein E6I73_05165 [Chloroflexota bacterium]
MTATLAALVMICGCSHAPAAPRAEHPYPKVGVILLSLATGTVKASASVGGDLVAVTLSEDGEIAYVADSAPGDVYALTMPALTVVWKQHVGGSPFGLLVHGGRLLVSLFAGAAVVALDPLNGAQMASYHVPAGPAEIALDAQGRVVVAGTRGQVTYLDGTQLRAGTGFAIALVDGTMWTEDYERAELVHLGDGHRIGLPLPLFPFWLAPGGPGQLLVSAEGGNEDDDPGGVFALDTTSEKFTTLARPRDPDQVVGFGTKVFVAAHGDKDVLAIDAEKTNIWAPGMPAVGLAPDAQLGLLAVVVNDHE